MGVLKFVDFGKLSMETASTLDSTDSSGLKVNIHNKSQNKYLDTLLLLTLCSTFMKKVILHMAHLLAGNRELMLL